MRHHYEKPTIYMSMYGLIYTCDHPVYSRCTLFQIAKFTRGIMRETVSSNKGLSISR